MMTRVPSPLRPAVVRRRPEPRAVVVAVHAVAFMLLALWSWRKWPDPLVDFGRELYLPWQITNGKVLYRDLASLFGPVSPYINALWFRWFGRALMTLAIANIAILAGIVAGIYHVIRVPTDRITATAATLTALLLFGFSQYLDVGNYNYVTPYSHEATHGMALSVAAIICWQAALATRRSLLAAVSGICAGLVLLTKPEIAVALAIAIVVGSAAAWRHAATRASVMAVLKPFTALLIVPSATFFVYFHLRGMGLTEAARAVAAGWISAIATPVARNAFYARMTGLDHPVSNAFDMLATFAGFTAFVALALGLSVVTPARAATRLMWWFAQVMYLLVVAFVVPRYEMSRALPVIAFVAGVACVRGSLGEIRRDGALRQMLLLTWCTFALALLAKMVLNAQLHHYGFYLALPAATVAVVFLLWQVPKVVSAFSGEAIARRTRWLLAGAIAVSIAPYLALSTIWLGTRTVEVGSGRDRFLAAGGQFWQGEAVRDAVRWLERETPAAATVAVVPEGVMINYLARRTTSVRFVNYMPPELIAFGETEIIRSFAAHPPDYVLLVDRDTSEYGYPAFGVDRNYGAALLGWIRDRYRKVARIERGNGEKAGGIEVLERVRPD
jgi:hypothetical protein